MNLLDVVLYYIQLTPSTLRTKAQEEDIVVIQHYILLYKNQYDICMNKAANIPHGPVISGGTGSHSSASAGGYSGASTYTNIINTINTNAKG